MSSPVKPGDTLPETLTLKPSRLRWVFVLVVGLAFCGTALFVLSAGAKRDDELPLWGAFAFFAFVSLVAVFGVFRWRSQLELNRDGFTCVTIFRTFSRKWTECSAFSPVSIGLNSFVGFSSVTDEAARPGLAAMNKRMLGASGMLPDRYGMSAGKLADLLNRFRARAMGATP